MDSTLKIIALNINSVRPNFDTLNVYLSTNDYDIIFLSETWFKENEAGLYNLAGYNQYIKCNEFGRSGGILFYLKNHLAPKDVQYIATEEYQMIAFYLTWKEQRIDFLGAYRSPSYNPNIFVNNLERILNRKKNVHFILLGDMNIDINKNKTIKSYVEKMYLDTLSYEGLKPLIITPTHVSQQTQTCIDHINARWRYPLHCKAAVVDHNITGSITYHRCVTLIVSYQGANPGIPLEKTFTFFSQKVFSEIIQDINWESIFQETDINKAFQKFILILRSTKEAATLTKKFNAKNKKRSPWITNELVQKCNEKNRLYKLKKKFPLNNEILSAFNKISRELQTEIPAAKKSYYNNKLSLSNSKELWYTINNEILKKPKKKDYPEIFFHPVTNMPIQTTGNERDIANLFNDFFIHIPQETITNAYGPQHLNQTNPLIPQTNLYSFYLKSLHQDDILQSINDMTNLHSAGVDGLSLLIFKENYDKFKDVLHHLFNFSLSQGYFPNCLKESIVIPVYKQKGDQKEVTNYRPISLIPTLGKIFEQCVKTKLVNYLEGINFFSKNQFGFRKGKNTSQAGRQHLEHLIWGLEKLYKVLGIYLDQARAFDLVCHQILLRRLSACGIGGNMFRWFKTYLNKRTQFVRFNGTLSTGQNILSGVPQGSVLGPILFITYMNELCNLVLNGNLGSFADDTATAHSSPDYNLLQTTTQNDLIKIQIWLRENHLVLNYEKCKMLIYSWKPIPEQAIHLVLHKNWQCLQNPAMCAGQCHELERTESVTYLGFTFDSHLTWKFHIEKLHGQLRKLNYTFFQLRKFLPPDILRLLYMSFYQSKLNYGIMLWGGTFETHLRQLKTLQNFTIRLLFGTHTQNSATQLYTDQKIFPINLLHKYTTVLHVLTNKEHYYLYTFQRNTRNASLPLLTIPRLLKTNSQNSIVYQAPTLYNKLLKNSKNVLMAITEEKSFITLKKYVHEYYCSLQLPAA